MTQGLFSLLILAFLFGLFALFARQVVGRVRRAMDLARQLKDPRQLGALLSSETRDALERTGVDPDALRIDSELDPELRRRVAEDLKRAFQGAVLGGGRAAPGSGLGKAPAAPLPAVPPRLSPPPAPYDEDPGAGLRWIAAAAIVAAAALYWFLRAGA